MLRFLIKHYRRIGADHIRREESLTHNVVILVSAFIVIEQALIETILESITP